METPCHYKAGGNLFNFFRLSYSRPPFSLGVTLCRCGSVVQKKNDEDPLCILSSLSAPVRLCVTLCLSVSVVHKR
jgi:hypothetical protein